MGALAEMLAKGAGHADAGEAPDADTPESNHKAMAAASIKAMFEAAKAGDYEAAAEHFSSASEHCENSEYNDPEEAGEGDSSKGMGHTALLLVPHGKK